MDQQIETLTELFSSMTIDDDTTVKIIKIQKWYRGRMLRLKRLPTIMYMIKKHLQTQALQFSNHHDDGRVNSCIDEKIIIKSLVEKFGERIKSAEKRGWYDILVYDRLYGWIPVNIKITMMKTSDNAGGLAMCVHAYTDEVLDVSVGKTYDNGKMVPILHEKLKNKNYNTIHKKDYYFIVVNKNDPLDVVVNSVKGLTVLTPNINNLPFQICWDKNREFKYEKISNKIKLFVECVRKPNANWRKIFIANMESLEL